MSIAVVKDTLSSYARSSRKKRKKKRKKTRKKRWRDRKKSYERKNKEGTEREEVSKRGK